MFIGREAELKFLNDKYNDNGGQLIVLYMPNKEQLIRQVEAVLEKWHEGDKD